MRKLINLMICSTLIAIISPFIAKAQEPIPYHIEPYIVHTNLHENLGNQSIVAFRTPVRFPGVPWLQIHFSDYNLGTRSYIMITSLQDGGQQSLDARSLPQWRNSSAYFNGDVVQVELYVAPGEQGVFFDIEEITVGEKAAEAKVVLLQDSESQCGPNDDRISSNDPAVGRIMPVGCTGWIVANGANLTAGHCINDKTKILEFNVPPSLSSGVPDHPSPENQYPIEAIANIDWFDGSIGNDWAVFETFANANGELAIHRQRAFYRMSRDYNPVTVRVTGYGIDSGPDNQTQQTHAGDYLGETNQGPSDISIEYIVDTMYGNSGSPVINTINDVAIGIHTNAGCNPPSAGNEGTSFENDNLENAIQTFPGVSVEYVDNGHPFKVEDGTVLRPYDTVHDAVNAASPGTIISIVRGSYLENLTINKPLILTAPVGVVTIGSKPLPFVAVEVIITRFEEIDDPDGVPFQPSPGDYYPAVTINNGDIMHGSVEEGTTDFPDWFFTAIVDRTLGSVPVTIRIMDKDFRDPDDNIDINLIDGVTTLNLTIDLNTGNWTGDIPLNQGFSEGDGDKEHLPWNKGGERGRIFFDIDIHPTAIELIAFTAEANVHHSTIVWETGTEIDNAGFNLHRATNQAGPYTKINEKLIPAEGDPVSGARYTYVDTNVSGVETYYYKLEDVDTHGASTFHGPISSGVALTDVSGPHSLYLPLITK